MTYETHSSNREMRSNAVGSPPLAERRGQNVAEKGLSMTRTELEAIAVLRALLAEPRSSVSMQEWRTASIARRGGGPADDRGFRRARTTLLEGQVVVLVGTDEVAFGPNAPPGAKLEPEPPPPPQPDIATMIEGEVQRQLAERVAKIMRATTMLIEHEAARLFRIAEQQLATLPLPAPVPLLDRTRPFAQLFGCSWAAYEQDGLRFTRTGQLAVMPQPALAKVASGGRATDATAS